MHETFDVLIMTHNQWWNRYTIFDGRQFVRFKLFHSNAAFQIVVPSYLGDLPILLERCRLDEILKYTICTFEVNFTVRSIIFINFFEESCDPNKLRAGDAEAVGESLAECELASKREGKNGNEREYVSIKASP